MPIKGKSALIAKMKRRSNQFVRAFALEGHKRLVQKTPVDTGRARNNWNMAIGSPDRENTDDATYPRSGQQSLAKAASVLPDIQAGDRIFSTNSLPYIESLENGSSKQAPQGMVKVTAAELRPLASRIAAKLVAGDV